ncbi:MAG: metallophosphoesterase, partial [Kiritimatiellae bacterium]|nr:metallophosphoesterase [Kiritimatiellia bacterium]
MRKVSESNETGNRLLFVGLAWVVSLLVTACVLPQAFGSWSETATMAAAAFLMLVFGPYLLVVGLCGGMVGDVGWGLVAMVPFVAAQVAFLWLLSGKTSLWRRLGRFGRPARCIAVAALAILSIVGVWSSLPCVETHKVAVGGDKIKGEPLRFVVISDLHSCYYGYRQRTILDAVSRERPDAVLLVGDIADDRLADNNAALLIGGLAKQFPCIYVSGNHEYWSERVDEIKAWIRSSGATVLEGDVRTVEIKGTMVDFCGIDDPTYILGAWFEQLKAVHEKSDPRHLRILLSHRPECA